MSGAGGELQYPPTYSVENYIYLHTPKVDARQFATMQTGNAFDMHSGIKERQTNFAG